MNRILLSHKIQLSPIVCSRGSLSVLLKSPISTLEPAVSLVVSLPAVSEPGEPPSCLLGKFFQLRQLAGHGELPAPRVPPLVLKQDQQNQTLCACRAVQGTCSIRNNTACRGISRQIPPLPKRATPKGTSLGDTDSCGTKDK